MSAQAVEQIFQSTLPAWGETYVATLKELQEMKISIHSPRMGRDARKIR